MTRKPVKIILSYFQAHGFVFVGGELVDDEEAIAAGKEGAKKPNSAAILSQKAAAMLEKCGEGSLEGRLR